LTQSLDDQLYVQTSRMLFRLELTAYEYLNATSSRLNQCYVRISPSVALQQLPRRLAQKQT
jgi:hypothetical protein